MPSSGVEHVPGEESPGETLHPSKRLDTTEEEIEHGDLT